MRSKLGDGVARHGGVCAGGARYHGVGVVPPPRGQSNATQRGRPEASQWWGRATGEEGRGRRSDTEPRGRPEATRKVGAERGGARGGATGEERGKSARAEEEARTGVAGTSNGVWPIQLSGPSPWAGDASRHGPGWLPPPAHRPAAAGGAAREGGAQAVENASGAERPRGGGGRAVQDMGRRGRNGARQSGVGVARDTRQQGRSGAGCGAAREERRCA